MSEKEYNLCADNSLCCDDDCQKCANRIYKAYCREHEKLMQKWIPVSERLPEDDSHVLVARKNGDVDTDMHIYTWWKVGPVERNITHWMPIPELPKEE